MKGRKSRLEKFFERRVEEIKRGIERNGKNYEFWCTFDAYHRVIGEAVWDKALEGYPQKAKDIINRVGLEASLDFDYWGNSSFFNSRYDREKMSPEEKEYMDNLYDNDHDLYINFLCIIDNAMWQIVEKDKDYGPFSEAIMKE